jgi:RHS repeat-associated protein
MNLSRYGDRDEQYLPIQIDNLGYGYATNSNKLMSVVDNSNNTSGFKDGNTTGNDYEYDVNGNMTVDKNKNITGIVYNHLNLPTKIIFPTGNIVYFYNASGQKVQKVVTENTTLTTTDYLGGYQYKNAVLQFFPTAEGYVKNMPVNGTNSYSYVFNYTDHLGNVRLSYTKNPSTNALTILEESNYYPFGLKHNGYNIDNFQPEYKYQYNGKEMQDELQLNLYDFGARNYDPALARWMNTDPLAEKFPAYSPYNFCLNNPLRLVDPDGRSPKDIIVTTKDGKALFTLDDGKKTVTRMTVAQLYKTGTQWFEPLADNYMPMKSQTKELSTTDKVKHFTSAEILEFAHEDRWMTSYRQGGSGDWKASEDGADGYLLSTIDNSPYWSDAIGQIPFAVDYSTDMIEDGKSGYQAIRETVQKGKEYGEGKIIGGTTDNSNKYDNYFILRGAANGANGRNITKPVTEAEAKAYGL